MEGKMSKYKYEGFGVIRNTETDFTYHTDDIAELLEEKDQRIADLEAKLTEKDAELEKWSTQYARAYVNRQNCLIAEKVELQKQLEEKDKEIEELKHFKVAIGTMENNQVDISSTAYVEQDKISFAVDILEELADCSNYINSKLDFECGSYVSEKAIRDKIKYLKVKKDE